MFRKFTTKLFHQLLNIIQNGFKSKRQDNLISDNKVTKIYRVFFIDKRKKFIGFRRIMNCMKIDFSRLASSKAFNALWKIRKITKTIVYLLCEHWIVSKSKRERIVCDKC